MVSLPALDLIPPRLAPTRGGAVRCWHDQHRSQAYFFCSLQKGLHTVFVSINLWCWAREDCQYICYVKSAHP